MDASTSADKEPLQRFRNAVQTTITQAIASGNLTATTAGKFTTAADDAVDPEATQELNLAEIDW